MKESRGLVFAMNVRGCTRAVRAAGEPATQERELKIVFIAL